MGKYGSMRKPNNSKNDVKPHPIWRGIGFLFMILAPIMGYFGTRTLLTLNSQYHWFPIPSTLLNREGIAFLGKIGQDPMLFIYAILTLTLTLVFFAVLQLISFSLYSVFGPKRYGLYDVPPTSSRKVKKSR